MTALPTLERLKELRATAAGHDWAYRDARCPMRKPELLALLDAAIALRKVEASDLTYAVLCERLVGHKGWQVELNYDGEDRGFVSGPDILSALTAALDKAEEKR